MIDSEVVIGVHFAVGIGVADELRDVDRDCRRRGAGDAVVGEVGEDIGSDVAGLRRVGEGAVGVKGKLSVGGGRGDACEAVVGPWDGRPETTR